MTRDEILARALEVANGLENEDAQIQWYLRVGGRAVYFALKEQLRNEDYE